VILLDGRLLLVGEANDFGHLTNEGETLVGAEAVLALCEEQVEATRGWLVFQDQRWPKLVLGEPMSTKDTRVLKRFQQLELALGSVLDSLSVFGLGFLPNGVKAHQPLRFLYLGVACQPVLISRPFIDEVLQYVI